MRKHFCATALILALAPTARADGGQRDFQPSETGKTVLLDEYVIVAVNLRVFVGKTPEDDEPWVLRSLPKPLSRLLTFYETVGARTLKPLIRLTSMD
jgi:hypothetical protein